MGRYLSILKWPSEKGFSLETWRRLSEPLMPRTASSWATVCQVIEGPRSEWMINSLRSMALWAHVSAMRKRWNKRRAGGFAHEEGFKDVVLVFVFWDPDMTEFMGIENSWNKHGVDPAALRRHLPPPLAPPETPIV